jgi:hypothetical protein
MSRRFGWYGLASPFALEESKGKEALFLIRAEAFLAGHAVPTAPKDSGRRRQDWLRVWELVIGASVS